MHIGPPILSRHLMLSNGCRAKDNHEVTDIPWRDVGKLRFSEGEYADTPIPAHAPAGSLAHFTTMRSAQETKLEFALLVKGDRQTTWPVSSNLAKASSGNA